MSALTTPSADYLEFAARYYVGADTFRESYFVSEVQQGAGGTRDRDWGHYFARYARYRTYWAHYENNVYRKVHRWANSLKDAYDLYDFTRSIFSPAYRIVEFWASHILGGALDPLAGDGISRPSALPIITENDAIRAPIAQVWRDSNWQAKKEILPRFGAAMGDAALMIVDDPDKGKVQLRVIDPRTLRDVTRDCFGNVKAYIREEQRPDPESRTVTGAPAYATYTEVCEKVGSAIRYATFRNGAPYDWREYADGSPASAKLGPEWTEDYDFVPLVFVQHRDMGQGWGWSELHPSLSKFHEIDDLASKLDDQIRIVVRPVWLFSGVVRPGGSGTLDCAPQAELMVGGSDDDDGDRELVAALYANDPATKAQALVSPLDIAASSAHIQAILAQITNEHPELLADDVGPQSSGEARKVAREKVEAMVLQRRAGYDDAMVRAHQMAISIGAIKGYPGFEGFTVDSYSQGYLEHSVGPRPVFAVDSMAKVAEAQARATVIKTLTDAGVSIEAAMREAGWGDEEIAAALASKATQDDRAMNSIRQNQALAMSDVPINGNGFAFNQ
jgi:hypothetical protein